MSGPGGRHERIHVRVLEEQDMTDQVAGRIAELVRNRERPVLGLATGSTPIGVYRELVRLHREDGLDFSNVVTFNLDEYFPMDPGSIHSYRRFMQENLFDHINIPPENIHFPPGQGSRTEVETACAAFEAEIEALGGIDYQILGIGRSGHIGFNEPGSGRESRTRLIYLDTITRLDAAADFFGLDNVPYEAVTMGVATILEAKEVALLATGEHKAGIIRRAVEGDISSDVAATYLQEHPNATVFVDPSSAAELTRIASPWVLQQPEWTPARESEAVVWLSKRTGKPILHLTSADYRDNHLSSLLSRYGTAGPLNGDVFNSLIAKVSGRAKLPRDERIVVFSPHPDDDVISMGGILRKLVENGNDITVAYQTSGNIAVFDHEVRRYVDFSTRWLGGSKAGEVVNRASSEILSALDRKAPGEPDEEAVLGFKQVIRETEAVSALEMVGLSGDNAVFLDLPFYKTGRIRKDPVRRADVDRIRDLLDETRPALVFAAGDLSDPHGTHRQCLNAVLWALNEFPEDPELWLYRGAWQEWPLTRANRLVPLSEAELQAKILAIYRHQSQKDEAPFPGPDPREFWERVRDRNRGTAQELARLGLPAYFAMEAFVVRRGSTTIQFPARPTATLGAF